MPRLFTKAVGLFLAFCILAGCNSIASFALEPYADVSVVVTARKASHRDFQIPGKMSFVYFRYVITARSDVPLYFKVENVSLRINGQMNEGAYYDSLATHVPMWRQLNKGETIIDVYAVFPGTIELTSAPNIQFLNLGLSRNPKNEVKQ